jgi:hypothetical protein
VYETALKQALKVNVHVPGLLLENVQVIEEGEFGGIEKLLFCIGRKGQP